jgi:prophage regulatory protein
MTKLPESGFLRLTQILGNPKANPPIPALIPISKSTWWEGVKSGRYPEPVRSLGVRITVWRVEDISMLIASASANSASKLKNEQCNEPKE